MAIITNVGIRGLLPRTICLICLTLTWMESALGLCLGCKIYSLTLRRGWAGEPRDRGVRRWRLRAARTNRLHTRAPTRPTRPREASLGGLAHHVVVVEQRAC